MIKPSEIPLFTGDCDGIETAASKLRSAGTEITARGSSIHSTVQSLRLSYRAPETENLFGATEPVRKLGLELGEHVRAVSHLLEAFAAEMRPIAADLKNLKSDAQDFVDENGCDPDQAWLEDQDKVDKNNQMIDDVSAKAEQMWDVERKYANAIEALFGGTRKFVPSDTFLGQMAGLGLLPGVEAYGMSSLPEVEIDGELQEGVELPWGTAAEWDAPWYVDVASMGASYYKGIYIDGLLGTIDGITTLIPIQPIIHDITGWDWANTWDDAGAAWENLGMTAAGVLLTSTGAIFAYGGAKALGWTSKGVDEFVGNAMNAELGAVKGIVAWDTWSEDPARAAGATTFNVGTFFLPGPKGLAASGKAGGILQAGVKLVDDAVAAVVKVDKVVLPKVGHLVKTINEGIGDMKTALKDTVKDTLGITNKAHVPYGTQGTRGLTDLQKPDNGTSGRPPRATGDLQPGTTKTPDGSPPKGPDHTKPGDDLADDIPGTGPDGRPLPHGFDPLEAATRRDLEWDNLDVTPRWRTDRDILVRSDSRSPEEIFGSGFEPWNRKHLNLDKHVYGSQHSAYVGTSRDMSVTLDKLPARYVYEIDAPGGIDVARTFRNDRYTEYEVAFPGGIRTEYVRGAWDYAGGRNGDVPPQWIDNPHYAGNRFSVDDTAKSLDAPPSDGKNAGADVRLVDDAVVPDGTKAVDPNGPDHTTPADDLPDDIPGTGPGGDPLPSDFDPLEAATTRDLPLGEIDPTPVWRTDRDILVRRDSRAPDEVFGSGFEPWNHDRVDLDRYINGNMESIYVGTTREMSKALERVASDRFIYEIDAPGGIDIVETYRGVNPYDEYEVAFPGGIRSEYVRGAWDYAGGHNGDVPPPWIDNPHYAGNRVPVDDTATSLDAPASHGKNADDLTRYSKSPDDLVPSKATGDTPTETGKAPDESAPRTHDDSAPDDGPAHDIPGTGPDGEPLPPGFDPLEAATHRDLPWDDVDRTPVWRTDRDILVRGDMRTPEEIFGSGFEPWNQEHANLFDYVYDNDPSIYVGTTRHKRVVEMFGTRYVYEIDAPGGVDIVETFGRDPMNEHEVAFPGGIKTEYISGAWDYRDPIGRHDQGLAAWVDNPHYAGKPNLIHDAARLADELPTARGTASVDHIAKSIHGDGLDDVASHGKSTDGVATSDNALDESAAKNIDHTAPSDNLVDDIPGTGKDGTLDPGYDALEVATRRDLPWDAMDVTPVWRTDHGELLRGDTRGPDEVFDSGFEPRDHQNMDLKGHVYRKEPSAFVSTTSEMGVARRIARYVYAIDGPGGIDVASTLKRNTFNESEFAFPGGIRTEFLKGVWDFRGGHAKPGTWIDNPHYGGK